MTPREQAAFAAGIQAARQAAMTAAVTIAVRDDARESRQQAAAAALHGLAAGLKVAFLDPPAKPDPTSPTCIPSEFAGADDGTTIIVATYGSGMTG